MAGEQFFLALLASHVVAAVLTLSLAVYVYRGGREKLIARVFAAMTFAFTVWTLGSLLRVFTTDPTLYVGVTTLKYVGVATAPIWFFLFGLVYADAEHLVTRRVTAGLLVVPLLTLAALATTQWHGIFYTSFEVTTASGMRILDTTRGPWFWAFAVYGWGLLVLGSGLLVYGGYRLPALYRTQAAFVVAGIAIPWAASLTYIFYDWPHAAVDPTPLGFAMASLLWALGVFSHDLVDIAPVARSRVVAALDDPVFVLDTLNRVCDLNEAAAELLDGGDVVGRDASDVVPPALAARIPASDGDR